MLRGQYNDVNDCDVDSICHELAYPNIDGGFYSDTDYASPGNTSSGNNSPGMHQDHELFTPINILQHKTLKNMSFLEHQIYTYNTSNPTINQSAHGMDFPAKITTTTTPKRVSELQERIKHSGYVFIPPSDSLLHNKHSDDITTLLKDYSNISPVTISSGYSSDKDDALRQLELEYTSDEHDSSPMMKRHYQKTADHYVAEQVNNNNKFTTLNNGDNGSKAQLLRQPSFVNSSSISLTTPVSDSKNSTGPRRQLYKTATSKLVTTDNRRNSIAVSHSYQRSSNEVNTSLSYQRSPNEVNTSLSHSNSNKNTTTKQPIKLRAASTLSNVTCSDIERLPEMLPAGVRTSYTTSSGILMTPSTGSAAHCRRCLAASQQSAVPSSPALNSSSSNFRISTNSAFKVVPHRNNNNNKKRSVTSQQRRNSNPSTRDVMMVSQAATAERVALSSASTPSGSRVTSLSDSGRGSISSIDLALLDVANERPEVSPETFHSNTPQRISYQTQPVEQFYENINQDLPVNQSRGYYRNSVQNQQPPKLPKRNSSVTQRKVSRSGRKGSKLVQYEDIVKPQDIVDTSAMHMYTVADVLKSVDMLSSDIQQPTNDNMCIHDDYAHFVFNPTSQQQQQARVSRDVNNSINNSLNHYQHQTNERLQWSSNERYSNSQQQQQHVTSDLSQPLHAKQNTACKAHTKRIQRTDDTCNSSSPCLRNKHNRTSVNLTTNNIGNTNISTFKSPAKRTVSCVEQRTRSKSLSRALPVNGISWSPRSNMAEVYC